MLLERIYDEDLAQASYLIACQSNGEGIVVDPRRDIRVYLDLAAKHNIRIVAVAETHIHADFLSGTRELAASTGATMYVSDEGGVDWSYGEGFAQATRMKHGHRLQLGNIAVEAVHTPGHTPEHMSFLVTDGAQSEKPGFLLSGDFVFVGDVGRPDLLDEAAGHVDTRFQGAKDLFVSLRDQFLVLPDYVQVLPGHGSGSACGKALGAIAATTVGYERNFAWWATYLQHNDEAGFVAELLNGQPDAHGYFARMKSQNKSGPALIAATDALIEFDAPTLQAELASGQAVLVDSRHNTQVHQGTVAGSLNVPGPAKSASYASWVYDPEREQLPLVLFVPSREIAEEMRDHLLRVGIDTVRGFITSLDGLPVTRPQLVTPHELEDLERVVLLDVRNKTEYAAGHLPGAVQLAAGRALWNLDQLPTTAAGPIVSYCQSGVRNSVIASALRREGYEVVELEGSYQAWLEAGLEIAR